MATVTVEEITRVTGLLQRAYPYILARKRQEGVLDEPPLDTLIRAILSQHTTDRNRDLAYHALRERYHTWDAVADAPLEELHDVIHASNHAYTKAGRMQQLLQRLRAEQGATTLDFLRDWPTDAVRAYLRQFPGVGEKSTAIVCLFALHRPVMPVDTHVYRVTQRLGWIGATVSAERAHALLAALLPPALVFPLHLGLWEHGRVTCRPLPHCAHCAIYADCRYSAKTAPPPAVDAAIAFTATAQAA
ncbi:MAG TPA: endonuclease III [Armatimonadota bacterium]|jgi:endonuclease-3